MLGNVSHHAPPDRRLAEPEPVEEAGKVVARVMSIFATALAYLVLRGTGQTDQQAVAGAVVMLLTCAIALAVWMHHRHP